MEQIGQFRLYGFAANMICLFSQIGQHGPSQYESAVLRPCPTQQALLPVLQDSVGRLRGAQMRRIKRQRIPQALRGREVT